MTKSKYIVAILIGLVAFTSCATQRHYDYTTEYLDFYSCNLDRVPDSVRYYKGLKRLCLERNRIKHVPRWITELDSLEEINLNYNQLRLRRSDIRHLSKAKQIFIGGNNLEKLPKNIGKLRCESLNLGKNRLRSLPPSFACLQNMKSLIFYENDFEEIPEVLADFKHLKHLDFYKNNLSEIPEFVGSMDSLRQLFLSFNHIKVIPDTLRNLKQLKYFYIHHNDLHFLPEWIAEMDSIERLGVSHNHLLELPDLSKMKSLREFDCEHNLLEHFPWELAEKPELEMLILRDNDFSLSNEDRKRINKLRETINIVY